MGGSFGFGVDTLVAAVDVGGVGLFNGWDRFGLVVGILRVGLGWLVVLGSGRKRLVYAVVGCNRVDPLAGGLRKARRV